MACGGGSNSGCGAENVASGVFNIPNSSGSRFNVLGYGLPLSPEAAVAGIKKIVTFPATVAQNTVYYLDEQIIRRAIRMTPWGPNADLGNSGNFKEIVKMDRAGNKYGMDIVLGNDTKPESLKISRKDNVMTIDVKTEKSAADGSSRLYQEYTRRITLPTNLDMSKLDSSLSATGILSIQAPFLPQVGTTRQQPSQSTKIPVVDEA